MWALIGWLVILKYAGWIVGAAIVGWLVRVAIPAVAKARADAKYRRELLAYAMARSAEQENREWLAAGIYEGRYPGTTMPLTAEVPLYRDGNQRDWYDNHFTDYDDGLTDWR